MGMVIWPDTPGRWDVLMRSCARPPAREARAGRTGTYQPDALAPASIRKEAEGS